MASLECLGSQGAFSLKSGSVGDRFREHFASGVNKKLWGLLEKTKKLMSLARILKYYAYILFTKINCSAFAGISSSVVNMSRNCLTFWYGLFVKPCAESWVFHISETISSINAYIMGSSDISKFSKRGL